VDSRFSLHPGCTYDVVRWLADEAAAGAPLSHAEFMQARLCSCLLEIEDTRALRGAIYRASRLLPPECGGSYLLGVWEDAAVGFSAALGLLVRAAASIWQGDVDSQLA
jgi:hypothetical protein